MRVLLVEDDASVALGIDLMLRAEGFETHVTDRGEEGIDLGKLHDYDIILLDLGLPDMSGHDVLRSLRASKVETPVLILSGLGTMGDKVRSLGSGADDFLMKPFHRDELVARIQAIVRRSRGHAGFIVTVDDLSIDLDRKVVEVAGARIRVTTREYQMLELMSLRKGMTLTKAMFLNYMYGGMDEPDAKSIDVFVCQVRRKLAHASGKRNYIETVPGRGYMLRDDVAAPRAMVG